MDALALTDMEYDPWEEVLQRVEEPIDKKNASETCKLFEEILSRDKIKWGFSLVLPLLFEGKFPESTLSKPDVLNLRRVCKPFKKYADSLLQSKGNYFDGALPGELRAPFIFRTAAQLQELIQRYPDKKVSPLIGNRMEVFHNRILFMRDPANGEEEEAEYGASLIDVLTMFGEKIRSFRMTELVPGQHLTYCKNIHSLLTRLPALKTLELFAAFGMGNYSPEELHAHYEEEGLDALSDWLRDNPFPNCPNLQQLVFGGLSSQCQGPLIERYAPRIKSLQLYIQQPFLDRVSSFAQLSKLELWAVDAGDTFNELRQLNSPLQVLKLHLRFDEQEAGEWRMDHFLDCVSHLPLEDLSVFTFGITVAADPTFSRAVHHPSLKKISIECNCARIAIVFDFVLCVPALEILCFSYRKPLLRALENNPVLGEGTVDLMTQFLADNVPSSNVWRVTPRLKRIVATGCFQNSSLKNSVFIYPRPRTIF